MTKAQLIAENKALKWALRVVCTNPDSGEAMLTVTIEKFNKHIEDMCWQGQVKEVRHTFDGVMQQCDKIASGGSVI